METNISKILDKRLKIIESEKIVEKLRQEYKRQNGNKNLKKISSICYICQSKPVKQMS